MIEEISQNVSVRSRPSRAQHLFVPSLLPSARIRTASPASSRLRRPRTGARKAESASELARCSAPRPRAARSADDACRHPRHNHQHAKAEKTENGSGPRAELLTASPPCCTLRSLSGHRVLVRPPSTAASPLCGLPSCSAASPGPPTAEVAARDARHSSTRPTTKATY